MKRPAWLIRLRVLYFQHRARKAISPAAWADLRRRIELAARHDDDAAIDRECQAVRDLVARLETAARVGSREARQRLKALRHNPVGRAAADAAEQALQRLDQQLLKGTNK